MAQKRPPTRAMGLAKITRPQSLRVLTRPRLFHKLDRGRKHSLIWIVGPPGAGKTTLVTSYLKARRLRCLWYQVDGGDSDPATFFHYLGLAVKQAAPRYRKPLPHLTPEYLTGLPAFTRRYFEDLFVRLKPPVMLVFDNYQEVPADSPFHGMIADALATVPKDITLLCLSRPDPPAVLARQRVNEAMTVIGWEELQLTLEETRGIVRLRKQERELPITLEQLHKKTQGWAAGLLLLLEQGKAGGLEGKAPNESTTQVLFDYFAGEILKKTDRSVQEFLLKTALLPTMTAALAEALTGLPHAGRLLADLYRQHYFTERKASAEPVYQYHPLFREFLRARAEEVFPLSVRTELQRQAGALLEQAGRAEEAVGLLQQAGDTEGVVRVLLARAPTLLAEGRIQTLAGWLRGLPAETLAQNPWLLYWLGMCRLAVSPKESRGYFAQAFELFRREEDPTGFFLAWSGVVETFIYEWGDFTPLDHWIAVLETMLAGHPEFPSPEIAARVAFGMFTALMYRQPHHADIERWEERVRAVVLNSPDPSIRMMIGHQLLLYHNWWSGDLAKAALVVNALRPLASSPGVSDLTRIIWHSIEATYYWMTASPENSLRAVKEGLASAQTSGSHLWDFMLCAQGVWASLIAGDVATAGTYLAHMASALDQDHGMNVCLYHDTAGIEALWRGDIPSAVEHGRTALAHAVQTGMPFAQAMCHITTARALFEHGEHAAAAEHLVQAHGIGREMKGTYIDYLCLLATAHFTLNHGDEARGLDALRNAFAVARRQGFWSHMWISHALLADLCAAALQQEIEVAYVHDLIRKRHLIPGTPHLHLDAWPWPLKIYTLGRFSVVKDGKPLELEAGSKRKPLELLMALIALGGSSVSQTKLTDALWPEVEGHLAQQTFEVTLHRLRKLIGREPALVLKDGKLSLDAHHCWVDSWACEHLFGRIERALHASPTEDIDRLATQLLALYQGPFLATEAEQPWLLSPRERLRSKFLRQFGALGRRWEADGKWDKAINGYLQGVEVDPLAEEFYRSLMRCYRRQGRPAEACAVYERCRNTLKTILGVDPSPETETLRRAIEADQTKRS